MTSAGIDRQATTRIPELNGLRGGCLYRFGLALCRISYGPKLESLDESCLQHDHTVTYGRGSFFRTLWLSDNGNYSRQDEVGTSIPQALLHTATAANSSVVCPSGDDLLTGDSCCYEQLRFQYGNAMVASHHVYAEPLDG